MVRRKILLISDDDWDLALLGKYFRDAGYEVDTARQARTGFDKARRTPPACVICAVELPDIDGFWVAKRLRIENSALARLPFVLLTRPDDKESGVSGLALGADLVLAPPYHEDEVVAQVSAVIDMASRFDQEGPRSASPAAVDGKGHPVLFEGDLSGMSLTTLLTLLDMERRAGTLTIGTDEVAVLELSAGAITGASLGGVVRSPADVLRACFGWQSGRFTFTARAGDAAPESGERVSALLLQVMQSVDEADREG